MTPPPTSIDGTDITGATIDGQDVQEITVDGQTVFTSTPPSLVARYEFEQDVTDSVGDADGTNNGGTFSSDSIVGSFSISFNADTGNHVDIGDVITDYGRASFAIWVNPSAVSSNAFNFAISNDSGGKNDDVFMGIDSNGNAFGFRQDADSDTNNQLTGSTLALNSWNHLVLTFASDGMHLYTDGTEDASNNFSEASTNQGGFEISSSNTSRSWDGLLADARIYNKALSDTEVSNLFNNDSIL